MFQDVTNQHPELIKAPSDRIYRQRHNDNPKVIRRINNAWSLHVAVGHHQLKIHLKDEHADALLKGVKPGSSFFSQIDFEDLSDDRVGEVVAEPTAPINRYSRPPVIPASKLGKQAERGVFNRHALDPI